MTEGAKDKTPELLALEALMRSPAWATVIYPKLVLLARPLARGTRVGPGDLVQDALIRLLDAARRGKGPVWEPGQHAQFVAYARPVLQSERSRDLRSAYNRTNVLAARRPDAHADRRGGDDAQSDPQDEHAHPDGTAEDAIGRARRQARGERRAEAVRGRLDPLARAVFDAKLAGNYDPERLAEEHGGPVAKIYEAYRRASRHTQSVIDADPDSSGPV